MLNIFETAYYLAAGGMVSTDILREAVQKSVITYDRAGERHYDTISAFIKSLRGSDPDAAVFYLARMILAGEDPEFLARRMVIFASEDVGNASPQALNIAVSTLTAVKNIGMPECEIVLSQCATFLASSPKSNASYLAIKKAKEAAEGSTGEVPMHLRNAPTGLMKTLGYAKGYRYPHDHEAHFVKEHYLPEGLRGRVFYHPTEEGSEKAIRERLRRLWGGRYDSGDV
jgi:putative ATPase